MGWAQREFETIDLGDPRLNRRAVLLAEQLGAKTRSQHSHRVRKLGGDGGPARDRCLR